MSYSVNDGLVFFVLSRRKQLHVQHTDSKTGKKRSTEACHVQVLRTIQRTVGKIRDKPNQETVVTDSTVASDIHRQTLAMGRIRNFFHKLPSHKRQLYYYRVSN